MMNYKKYQYQAVHVSSQNPQNDVELQQVEDAEKRHNTRREWSALLLLPLMLLIVLALSRKQKAEIGGIEAQTAAILPLLGKSHHHKKSSAKNRLLDDCTHIDVSVPCQEAYFHPLFRNYIDFQRTMGVDIIAPVGEKTYELFFAGMNVTLYVNYNDETLIEDVELVDGFDFFDAYHETWKFVSLPTTETCRSVVGDKRGDLKQGCRIFHSFIAIFGEKAPVTKKEWFESAYEEALAVRDFVEA